MHLVNGEKLGVCAFPTFQCSGVTHFLNGFILEKEILSPPLRVVECMIYM